MKASLSLTSSSSSSTTQAIPASQTRSQQTSIGVKQANLPAIIPLDYNYRTMAPSTIQVTQMSDDTIYNANTSSTRSYQQHPVINESNFTYNRLFGDPITSHNSQSKEFSREDQLANSFEDNSSEENPYQFHASLDKDNSYHNKLLHYSKSMAKPLEIHSECCETTAASTSTCTTMSSLSSRYSSIISRLQPPDIEILSNSSDTFNINSSQPINLPYLKSNDDLSDLGDNRIINNVTTRRMSYTTYIPLLDAGSQIHNTRDFRKMPELRPSSKNVLSIKSDQMPIDSPVAAMINDSVSSNSSGGDADNDEHHKKLNEKLELELALGKRIIHGGGGCIANQNIHTVLNTNSNSPEGCKIQFLQNDHKQSRPTILKDIVKSTENIVDSHLQHDTSSLILKKSVTIGGDFRIKEESRLHKKPSFIIMNEKPAYYASYVESRGTNDIYKKDMKKYLAKSSKSTAINHYAKQKYVSSSVVKLPHLIRPSVQFNISSDSGVTDNTKILQTVHNYSDDMRYDGQSILPFERRRNSSLPYIVDMDLNSQIQLKNSKDTQSVSKKFYNNSLGRLYLSDLDLGPEKLMPRPLKQNPNPTRKHKGLLKVLNGYEYQSRIPLHSDWTSMDDMVLEQSKKKQQPSFTLQNKYRRRSSSTSPSRRSSTLTTSDRRSSNFSTITTSDLSYRRSSLIGKPSTQMQNEKSVFQIFNRISNRTKPLVSFNKKSLRGKKSHSKIIKHIPHLSPILGTPNKDSQTSQSSKTDKIGNQLSEKSEENPEDAETVQNAATTKRDSISETSMQNQRKSNRSNSQISLRAHSRASTKSMETSISQLSFKSAFRSNSAKLIRKSSSRIPSRSTSRASIQPSDSRSASRLELPDTNSTTNSTISLGKAITKSKYLLTNKEDEQSKQKSRILSRRKSSFSDAEFRLTKYIKESVGLSDKAKIKAKTKEISKTTSKQHNDRRNSRSRIPIRNGISQNKSPSKRKAPLDTGLKRISSLKVNLRGLSKKNLSSKKNQTSESKQSKTEEAENTSEDKNIDQNEDQPVNSYSSKMNTAKRKIKVLSNMNRKSNGSKQNKSENKIKTNTNTNTKVLNKKTDKHTSSMGKKGFKKSNDLSNKTSNSTSQASNQTEKTGNDGDKITSATTTLSNSSAKVSTVAGREIKREPSTTSMKRMNSRSSLLSKKHSDSNLKKHVNENIKTEKASGNEGFVTLSDAMTEKSENQSPNMLMDTINEPKNPLQNTTIYQNDVQHQGSDITKSPIPDSREIISPTSSVTTVVENRIQQTTKTSNGVNSVSRQGTVDDLKLHELPHNLSPISMAQPIEATVSILNGDSKKSQNLILSDSSSLADKTHISKEANDRISERAISIMPQVDNDCINNQTYQSIKTATFADSIVEGSEAATTLMEQQIYDNSIKGLETEAKRHSPDGQGGSNAPSSVDVCIANNNNNNNINNEDDSDTKHITDDNVEKSSNCLRNCCQHYFRCCMPCRRSQHCSCLRCLRCSRCPRKKLDNLKSSQSTDEIEIEKAVVTSSSSTLSFSPTVSTTKLEMIDEKKNFEGSKRTRFLRKLCCCCYKSKNSGKSKIPLSEAIISENNNIQTISNESHQINVPASASPAKQRKFCACLYKIFCCRSVNKIDPKTGHDIEVKNCCFCIPCRKKRDLRETARAWHDVEAGLETNNTIDPYINDEEHVEQQQHEEEEEQEHRTQSQSQQQQNCCKHWYKFLFCCWCCRCRSKCRCCNCCRRKNLPPPPPPSSSSKVTAERRRSSIKKPPEDTRKRLHVDLIEYNSKMKAAIPILPLWLAWVCAICNVLVPGLGTLLSGFFCICVGIPRFSQYDSVKARVGSLIINIIVAVSQLFCVLFCLVGWGWSIWWATIMLKVARKLCKIRRVERLELEEEQRQADLAQQQQQQLQQLTPAKLSATKESETHKI